ncbi:MAG: MBL fold metallo-hydrolase [Gemmatimonadetes bacterium]|nr:MBL fold metallo-hydrolase [Gemmatimonadota bacterium]
MTHLHSDHMLGLADLIFTSWVVGRSRPFPASGPAGLQRLTEHLYAAFEGTSGCAPRARARVGRGVPDCRARDRTVVYDSGGVKVTAFLVPHGAWKQAFGYRFDTPDRSIVVSGDTRPSEELVRMASGVDVLVHEVQPSDSTAPPGRRAPRAQILADIRRGWTGPVVLAEDLQRF